MIIRTGRRGQFLGCSGYPKCKNTGEVPAKLAEELGLNGQSANAAAALARHRGLTKRRKRASTTRRSR